MLQVFQWNSKSKRNFCVKFLFKIFIEISFFNIFKSLMVYLLHVYYFTVKTCIAKRLLQSVIFSKVSCRGTATLFLRVSSIDISPGFCKIFNKTLLIVHFCTATLMFCNSLLVCFVFCRMIVQIMGCKFKLFEYV